jgi:lysine-specific permease
VALVILVAVNLIAGVKGFGESEYFFSIVKVVAVIAFLFVGILLDLGFPNGGFIGLDNWKENTIKNGVSGIFDVFLIAFFAFGGTELIGMAASETRDPKNTLPKAISQTIIRICLFYIGSIFIIGLLIPSSDPRLLDPNSNSSIAFSPFTIIFTMARVPGVDHLINLVVVFAILSAANSAMYAASRTLMGLSYANQAPSVFGYLYNGVPVVSLGITVIFGFIAFAGKYFGEGAIFDFLIKLSGASGNLYLLMFRDYDMALDFNYTSSLQICVLASRKITG